MSKEKLFTGEEVNQLERGELGVSPHLVKRLVASYKRAMVELVVSRRVPSDIMLSNAVTLTPDILIGLRDSAQRVKEFLDEFNRRKSSQNFCAHCGAGLEEKP